MSIKLRDLIRAVRACKTAAEERAVISKECALIRTAIKEEDETFRHRNVAKLLFIHMLGYPTHFGQMECLKLISAQSFPEKRIGYLGLTLLLNEQTEVLTLVTNSLKIDLQNTNQYIQALSLIAIGNMATPDMARDLASDVDKHLRSSNSYLRKKAALAAIRLLRKDPDLIETMSDRIVALLKDRAHGVLITGIQLVNEVIQIVPEMKDEYVKLVPSLVRLLRNFMSMGFSPEHDVNGITDPFMQVKLLNLLKVLGRGNEEASEQMNDVLAQVATNTETSKNAGNAILYECVQTIMEVESDSNLRVLAVNILGRFLLNRDNNIRYVALNSLTKVVNEDVSAVQRHRNTIVDCLKDPDVSIRQRALELIYQLVNQQNVVELTAELLNYLIVAQTEHKVSLVSKIIQIVERFSPNKQWRVDTIITMLSVAGHTLEDSISRTSIIFLAQSDGLQGYIVHRLYRCIVDDRSQLSLVQVTVWCIGEYGNLLVRDCSFDGGSLSAIPEADVVSMLDKCLKLHNVDNPTKAIIVNALVKLSVRLSAAVKSTITGLIRPFQNSLSLELQQRSTEYMTLIESPQFENLRRSLLDRMPVLDEAAVRRRRAAFDENTFNDSPKQSAGSSDFSMPVSTAPKSGGDSLLDLDVIFGSGPTPVASSNVYQASAPSASNEDLLSQIFSSSAPASAPMQQQQPIYQQQQPIYQQQQQPIYQQQPIDMLNMDFSNASIAPQSAMPPAAPINHIAAAPVTSTTIQAFDKAGFQVIFIHS